MVFNMDPLLPPQISPELVLVSPPEVARAVREALEPPPASTVAPRPAEASAPVLDEPAAAPLPPPRSDVPRAPAPVPRPKRFGSPALAAAGALVLVAAGFLAGRELGVNHRSPAASRAAPDAAASSTQSALPSSAKAPKVPSASPTTGKERQPLVTWKPRAGLRRYRFDLISGRVTILTIVTNEPRMRIPLTWPNAGRIRHLAPGRYRWTVRPATAASSRLIARGAVTIGKPGKS